MLGSWPLAFGMFSASHEHAPYGLPDSAGSASIGVGLCFHLPTDHVFCGMLSTIPLLVLVLDRPTLPTIYCRLYHIERGDAAVCESGWRVFLGLQELNLTAPYRSTSSKFRDFFPRGCFWVHMLSHATPSRALHAFSAQTIDYRENLTFSFLPWAQMERLNTSACLDSSWCLV